VTRYYSVIDRAGRTVMVMGSRRHDMINVRLQASRVLGSGSVSGLAEPPVSYRLPRADFHLTLRKTP
jgi:hypothetical protein